MQLCRSSSMSRCFRAKEAVFWVLVLLAERCVKREVNLRRTSKGSAIARGCQCVVSGCENCGGVSLSSELPKLGCCRRIDVCGVGVVDVEIAKVVSGKVANVVEQYFYSTNVHHQLRGRVFLSVSKDWLMVILDLM